MTGSRHVAVLITAPARGQLTAQLVSAVREALPDAGPSAWLAVDEAAEIAFNCTPDLRKPIAAGLATMLASYPVDVAVVPAASRRKRLLVADMDSTIIGQECIDELADLAGVGGEVAAITERSMQGEIDFVQSLTERVALLAGLPGSALEEVARSRITLNPGAKALAATMRRHGATTAIVSGGFTVFTEHVRQLAGFDRAYANTLEIGGGRLTGRLVPPILDQQAKREIFGGLARELGLDPPETLALGDGANDLGMISAAGLGVAFRGKPILRQMAGAGIEHGDLTAVLYLQGYRAGEITS
jgi:phosphoserine phosphatase